MGAVFKLIACLTSPTSIWEEPFLDLSKFEAYRELLYQRSFERYFVHSRSSGHDPLRSSLIEERQSWLWVMAPVELQVLPTDQEQPTINLGRTSLRLSLGSPAGSTSIGTERSERFFQ